jgi:glycosyltransferase involved in cell wall biosynthesis
MATHDIKEIKMLHLVHRYTMGGAEVVLNNVCKYSSQNITNVICSFAPPDDHFIADNANITLLTLNKGEGNDYKIIQKIKQIISKYEIDIVHAQGWSTYIEGLLAAKFNCKRRCKFLFAFHGKTIEDIQVGIPFRRKFAQKLASYFSDKIIAPSKEMIADYQTTFHVSPRKTQVIYNGIELERFGKKRPEAKTKVNLPENSFVIGFVGRLDPVKNIPGIIKAFKIFHDKLAPEEQKKIFLFVVGDGSERQSLEELTATMSLQNHIIFQGRTNEVPQCLNAMDVYMQPSFYEGHSNTILEAMAASLPVISSTVGGTPEIIEHGVNGFLFQPDSHMEMAETLLHLFQSSDLCEKVGEKACQYVSANFSVENMVMGYERMYAEILGTSI